MGTWKSHRDPTPQQQQEFDDLLKKMTELAEANPDRVAFPIEGQRIVLAGIAWYYEEDNTQNPYIQPLIFNR